MDLNATTQYQRAVAALKAGNMFEAEGLAADLNRRQKGRDPRILELLGSIATARRQEADADRYFRAAIQLAPKNALLHVQLARVLVRQARYDEALKRYDRALRLHPHLGEALLGKSGVFMVRGEYDKSRDLLDAEVRAGRATVHIFGALADVYLRLGKPEKTIELASGAFDSADVDPQLKYRMGAALGKAYERLGDYPSAFGAYEAGNRAVRQTYNHEAHVREIDALISNFDVARFPKLPRASHGSRLPVFIASMPRSGSTLVEQIIASHPQAFGAGEIDTIERQAQNLGMDIPSTAPYPACVHDLIADDLDRLSAVHLAHLGELGGDAERVVNKSLLNYANIGLIHLLFPEAAIIYVQRNGMDNCFSCFAETLNPSTNRYSTDLPALGAVYREHLRIMAHWRDALGIPLLHVRYEELVADQENWSRRIIDFCGLPWDPACLRYHESGRDVQTLSHDQVRKPMYTSSVSRAERFGPLLDPLREALGDALTA